MDAEEAVGLIIRDKNPSSANGAEAGGKLPAEVFLCRVEDGPSDGLVVAFFTCEALRATGGCDAFAVVPDDLGALPARL